MNKTNRGSIIAGIGLICLGAILITFNLIPGMSIQHTWPVIFIVAAFAFYLPAIAWPDSKQGLAALYIPGTILLGLGAIFLFNTLTKDWAIWAFAWILIPACVGLGIMLASLAGKWGRVVWLVGIWMAVISFALFATFAALFGDMIVKFVGASLLVAMGLYLLIRSFLPKQVAE